jgi:DNA-binding MarR family transcriptional regulator
MAEKHYMTERLERILGAIAVAGPLTNTEIAASLCMKYRAVQRATCKLAEQGYIMGQFNSYGRCFSNVSWRINRKSDDNQTVN